VGGCTAEAAAWDGGHRQPERPEGPRLLPSPSNSGGDSGPNGSCAWRRCCDVMEVARMGGGARGAPGRPRASVAPPSPTSVKGYAAAALGGATAYAWPRLVKPDDSRPQATPML
jgi:hypothetical protein